LRKASSTRRVSVCLLSFHPLLLSEFQRLLTGGEVRLLDRRVEHNRMPDASLALPRASAYVIEAHAQRQVTEAFVATILGRFPKGRLIVVADWPSRAPFRSCARVSRDS
jgi:hypothetical protein